MERMKTEKELKEELKQIETQMGGIVKRVKSVDEVLNVNLSSPRPPGSTAAIQEYLTWLDRVEALGLSFVNGNIVTQRLRLFYTRPESKENKTVDPSPRMREVKNLLEAVRHADQTNLLALRARRHSLHAHIQKLERKAITRAGRRSGLEELKKKIQAAIWLQIAVLIIAILVGGVLFESFRPEIIHFIRSTIGVRDTPSGISAPAKSLPSQREKGLDRLDR
jgi:hypothetical protein